MHVCESRIHLVLHSTKRLIAAWRVLVGVWTPTRWDLSLSALAQYSTPRIPPENPWVDRSKIKTPSPNSSPRPPPSPPTASGTAGGSPSRSFARPPSRRLIRHVLRARGEAARGLARLFAQLERPSVSTKRVRASSHLAIAFGGTVDESSGSTETADGMQAEFEPRGWRSIAEVVAFLRARGAKIQALENKLEGDWAVAALSSDGEGSGCDSDALGPDGVTWRSSGVAAGLSS